MDSRARCLTSQRLQTLIEALQVRGYEVLGPRREGPAIGWGAIGSLDDLASGWEVQSEPGSYHIRPAPDSAFRFAAGPPVEGLKRWLIPPECRLFRAERTNGHLAIRNEPAEPPLRAFLGVRPCDLAAVEMLDRVFLEGPRADIAYRQRRRSLLLIGANCTTSRATCFCASLGTGPRARSGFDILLTECEEDGAVLYLAEAGSEQGEALLSSLEAPAAPRALLQRRKEWFERAAAMQTRSIRTAGASIVFEGAFDHPLWEEAERRCLACANCTSVCPTCYCTNTEERSAIDGTWAERWSVWDSCFTQGFSYIHGGSIRLSGRARFRQRLSHKLGRWQAQFGAPGCTGCGRCMTWCPVGIDPTREFAALEEAAGKAAE
jgi:ferredoxin